MSATGQAPLDPALPAGDPRRFGVTLDERAAWDDARERCRVRIRAHAARLKELRKAVRTEESLRDDLIRSALTLNVPAPEISKDAGVQPARIYQIRDGFNGHHPR